MTRPAMLIVTAVLAGMFGPHPAAQTAIPPTFEVASIRRSVDTDGSGGVVTVLRGGTVTATRITLRELIRNAYEFTQRPRSHVTGGPSWIDRDLFDVAAKAGREFQSIPSGPSVGPPAEAAAMLRALLADRFRVKTRVERQPRPVYAMVLDDKNGRPGPQLTPSDGMCAGPYSSLDERPKCPFVLGGGRFEAGHVTMPQLALLLALFPAIDRVVIDHTGLDGAFDFRVRFQGLYEANAAGQLVPRAVGDGDTPPLVDALRTQLGLRLEKQDGVVDVLIVEHAEQPTDN